MSERPTGTVTFLFTDIEGSTQLLHELGAEYGNALEDHRQLLREAFAAHAGHVFGTTGRGTAGSRRTIARPLAIAGDSRGVLLAAHRTAGGRRPVGAEQRKSCRED